MCLLALCAMLNCRLDLPARQQLADAIATATKFCTTTSADTAAAASDTHRRAADVIHVLTASLDAYRVIDAMFGVHAANSAAAVLKSLADGGCVSAPTSCNGGAHLMHSLRGFLLITDGGSLRALVGAPRRRAIFDKYKVFVADANANHFDAKTMFHVDEFFGSLPLHLLQDGVLAGAPFATMTARSTFLCENDEATNITDTQWNIDAGMKLGYTARAFNVFATQTTQSSENAFYFLSDYPLDGDLMVTVMRHEVAHQFDRYISADAAQSARKLQLRAASTGDIDWLRTGNEYLQANPQEVTASLIGNQYLLSSSNQLRLAISRLMPKPVSLHQATSLPLAWFLSHLELFADPTVGVASNGLATQTLMYEPVDGVSSIPLCVEMGRNQARFVSTLRIPGCSTLSFSYSTPVNAGDTVLPESISPQDWSCVPSFDPKDTVCAGPFPRRTTSTSTTATTSTMTTTPCYYTYTKVAGRSPSTNYQPGLTLCDKYNGHHYIGWCAVGDRNDLESAKRVCDGWPECKALHAQNGYFWVHNVAGEVGMVASARLAMYARSDSCQLTSAGTPPPQPPPTTTPNCRCKGGSAYGHSCSSADHTVEWCFTADDSICADSVTGAGGNWSHLACGGNHAATTPGTTPVVISTTGNCACNSAQRWKRQRRGHRIITNRT